MSLKEIYNKLKKKRLSMLNYSTTIGQVDRNIKRFIQDKKLIVTGSRALNAHASFPYQRAARDYDVFTKTDSKPIAQKLNKILDKVRRGNYHYVKPSLHRGTNMLMDIGADLKKGTKDDFELVSMSRLPRQRFKTVQKNNTIYAHLDELEKAKMRTVRFKKYGFRHRKDLADLKIIQKLKKGGLFFT